MSTTEHLDSYIQHQKLFLNDRLTPFFGSKLKVKPCCRGGTWCPLERAGWYWSLFWPFFLPVKCSSSCQSQRSCELYILKLASTELLCSKEGLPIVVCSFLMGSSEGRQTKGQRWLSQLETQYIAVMYVRKNSSYVVQWSNTGRRWQCKSLELSWTWSWVA